MRIARQAKFFKQRLRTLRTGHAPLLRGRLEGARALCSFFSTYNFFRAPFNDGKRENCTTWSRQNGQQNPLLLCNSSYAPRHAYTCETCEPGSTCSQTLADRCTCCNGKEEDTKVHPDMMKCVKCCWKRKCDATERCVLVLHRDAGMRSLLIPT